MGTLGEEDASLTVRKMLLLPKLLRSFGLGQRAPYLILCLESPKKVGFLLTAIFGHNARRVHSTFNMDHAGHLRNQAIPC